MLLSAVNYATPIAVALYYIATTVCAWCTLQHKCATNSSRWRQRGLIILSCALTACYAAQSLRFFAYLAPAPDDGLVHALSQFLLWTTLSLILINTENPLPTTWIGVGVLNFLLESTICILTFMHIRKSGSEYLYVLGGLQIVICLTLLAHISTASLLIWQTDQDPDKEERRSLLGSHATSSCSSIGALSARHVCSAGDSRSDASSSSDTDNDESDDDGDDNAELRALQQKRLEQKGNWLSYLRDFRIFLPYVLPKDNLRMQIYVGFLVLNTLVIRALNVLKPRQLGIIVDALTSQRILPWKQILVWIALNIADSNSCGLGAANEMLENRISAWSRRKLSVAAFDHVMSLSMVFHDQKDSGEIIKAIEQANSLNSLLRVAIVDLVPGILDIVIAMVYIAYLFDVYALLIITAVGICFVFATYYITILATKARRHLSSKEREESQTIYESVSNWSTISYFNRRKYAMARLSNAAANTSRATLWSDDLYTYLYGAQEIAEQTGFIAVIFLAAYRIVQGTSTIGKFVTLESYWHTMTMPLYILGHSYRRLNSDLVDAERLLQLFQQQPTITDKVGAQPIVVKNGEVQFDNVEFAYEGREATLRGITAKAEPGQLVALVGSTGSGKSTTFKLLMRFHDVTAGRITIDGQNIGDVTLDSLRECFGFVPQDTVLFNMSVLENVRYGRLDATDEEVYEACRAASIHDKILSFPKGYLSKVGERGVKLSGGERQRIAIARVFLKRARIVLLDEATSAMDSQTEAKIQAALKELTKGRTTFVIAHRLSTVVEANKIFVMDDGRIVESGTHHELLRQKGKYLDLWTKQTSLVSDLGLGLDNVANVTP